MGFWGFGGETPAIAVPVVRLSLAWENGEAGCNTNPIVSALPAPAVAVTGFKWNRGCVRVSAGEGGADETHLRTCTPTNTSRAKKDPK